MPEMLPCPLSLTARGSAQADEIGGSSAAQADYLDPSNESDYELISRLRQGLQNNHDEDDDEDTIQPYNTVTVAEIEANEAAAVASSDRQRGHQRRWHQALCCI